MIKRLENEEILTGLHFAWEVFSQELLPEYTEEAVQQFQDSIRLENVMKDIQAGRLFFWGDFEKEGLCAVCAMRPNGHIEFLLVKKEYQRRGIAQRILAFLWNAFGYGTSQMRMTIQAPVVAEEAMAHLGFCRIAPEQERGGVPFVLMERRTYVTALRPKKKSKTGLAVGIGIGAILLAFMGTLVFLTGRLTNEIIGEQKIQSDRTAPWSEDKKSDSDKSESSGGTGIEAIECYEAENLPYTITEKTYSKESDGSDGGYYLQFDIRFPQIEGLEGRKADKINRILEECAMSTVETLYLNPSDSLKESMLQQSKPMLASQVTYKVTYASEDFISVVFSDHYFSGNVYSEFQDLRTRNIRLSDGKIFTTAEIVDLSPDFMEKWLEHMAAEAPRAKILDLLTTNEFRRILGGEVLENRYYDNFFVDAEGMEIGLTFHYNSGDEENVVERGWITAPFTMVQLKPYQTDSEFWRLTEKNSTNIKQEETQEENLNLDKQEGNLGSETQEGNPDSETQEGNPDSETQEENSNSVDE